MKHVRKSVLLWYSARQMYDLVTQVQAYPEFLPWCDRAEVLEQTEQGMTARLGLAFSGLRHAFTTRNTHQAGRLVTVELVDGPFSRLEGRWAFTPVGGTPAEFAQRLRAENQRWGDAVRGVLPRGDRRASAA